MKQTILGLAVIAGMVAGVAQAEPLKVKPGLWEVTTRVSDGKVKTPTNLDKVKPELRDKVMEKLKAQHEKVMVRQSCLTKAQLDKGDAFMGGSHHQGCKNKAVKQTAKEWVTQMECSGKLSSKGEIRMQAVDPETMTGTVTMTAKSGEQTKTTTSTLSSKWLGDDCSVLSNKALTDIK